jgi:hypothetical protein
MIRPYLFQALWTANSICHLRRPVLQDNATGSAGTTAGACFYQNRLPLRANSRRAFRPEGTNAVEPLFDHGAESAGPRVIGRANLIGKPELPEERYQLRAFGDEHRYDSHTKRSSDPLFRVRSRQGLGATGEARFEPDATVPFGPGGGSRGSEIDVVGVGWPTKRRQKRGSIFCCHDVNCSSTTESLQFANS